MGAHIENTPKRNLNVWPSIILRSFKSRLWNCESSMPMHCSAICYVVERTLKIAHKLCPTFQLIEVFQCIDSGLFFINYTILKIMRCHYSEFMGLGNGQPSRGGLIELGAYFMFFLTSSCWRVCGCLLWWMIR